MSSIMRWAGRVGIAATVAATVVACADPVGLGRTNAGGRSAMVACDPSDPSSDCGGGGGGGGTPAPTVKLFNFQNVVGAPNHEYYEIRQTGYRNGGAVWYSWEFVHGDAFASNEFTTGIDLGNTMPCFGYIDVQIVWSHVNMFGHVDYSHTVGSLQVTPGDWGHDLYYTDTDTGQQGTLRYNWPSCTN